MEDLYTKDRYRGPSLYKKVRRLVTNNKSGDVWGVTLPSYIAEQFFDEVVKISLSGDGILIERSGCIFFEDYY